MEHLLSLVEKYVNVEQLENLSGDQLEEIIKEILSDLKSTPKTKYDDPDYEVMKMLQLEQFSKSSKIEVRVKYEEYEVCETGIEILFTVIIKIKPEKIKIHYNNAKFRLDKNIGIVHLDCFGEDSYDPDFNDVSISRDKGYYIYLCGFDEGQYVMFPLSLIKDQFKEIIKKCGEEKKIDVSKFLKQLDTKNYEYEK